MTNVIISWKATFLGNIYNKKNNDTKIANIFELLTRIHIKIYMINEVGER